MHKTIVILHGESGVGKSTVARYLEHSHGFEYIHAIKLLKEHLELAIGKPKNFLNTKEGKAYVPPASSYTMQEIMVNLFHFWREHWPLYGPSLFLTALTQSTADKLVLDGLRNVEEVDNLQASLNPNDTVILLRITRPGVNSRESSDMYKEQVEYALGEVATHDLELVNDSSIKVLLSSVLSILQFAV